ncbi:MAG: hypothetical protein E6J39_10255 [Chloroflexi bacterium]|nr:MAG: hypothetical protein E6J39_10255 [Chloroflexota bacterium]
MVDAVISVNGRPALPNVPSRSLLEHGPLEPDAAALDRISRSSQRAGERLLTAVVADGWNGSLVDERIRFKLTGPTWFLTFIEPDGTIRSVGVDERTGVAIWPTGS